jgi:hypothetical protein
MVKILVQKKITDFYKSIKSNKKKINNYNPEIYDNYCLICGISMGPNNPRQLCRKTWCQNSID